MTVKKITVFAVAILLAGLMALAFVFRSRNETKIDIVAVNDITQSLAEKWDSLGSGRLPGLQYKLDYVVLGTNGNVVCETRRGLNENINAAIGNRDTIVEIARNGRTFGKLILYNDTGAQWEQFRRNLLVCCAGVIVCLIFFLIGYSVFIDRKIFRPFRRLQSFASHVAEGNLDIPLDMDKGNLFGAFTESFDLMRHELALARESERLANESKKELVASLSHDIKTPVASIKAVSEIMAVKTHDENERRHLEIINSKADQINTLITNLFNATLEELQRLSVTAEEQPSLIIRDLIRDTDYDNKVTLSPIPECMILADRQRLLQVVDNIISNSYKYAGTSINVTAATKGRYLEIQFADFGHGVGTDEIPLLFHKYYRAKNASGKNGAGLGLYISKYLMNKMSGDIVCKNTEDGFAVTLKLLIAQ